MPARSRRTAGSIGSLLTRDGRSRASCDPNAMTAGADHLGLVAVDRGDRAAHAHLGRLDRIARRERRQHRQRLVERAQRLLGLRRPLGSRTEAAIRVGADAARRAARNSTPQRRQLGTRVGQLGLRVGRARLARSRSADARTFSIFAPSSASRARTSRAATRASSRDSTAARSAASVSASSSAMRNRSGSTRARASATTAASSPSRSAVCSACDVPGLPSVIRYSGSYVSGSSAVAALTAAGSELAHSFSSG